VRLATPSRAMSDENRDRSEFLSAYAGIFRVRATLIAGFGVNRTLRPLAPEALSIRSFLPA
jgi:hypothetical protein